MLQLVFLTTLLFLLGLLAKSLSGLKFCVLCSAIFLSWSVFLLAGYLGFLVDILALALYMGSTIVGLMYFLEKRIPEKWKIFRLPFLLTLLSLAYALLNWLNEGFLDFYLFVFLALFWLVFLVVFLYLEKTSFLKKVGKEIIKCCRDW